MLDGQLLITGGVLSTTVTVAVHWLLFPDVSVTVNVTEFAPLFEQVNELGDTVMEASPQGAVLPLSTSAAVMLTVPDESKATVMFLQTAVGGPLIGTLAVFEALQPKLFVTVRLSVTLPEAPAVYVMVSVFDALVIVPLLIVQA
jgi:hypothetical protein